MVLIPSINVHRPVEAVGLDGHGAMKNTVNLWNAGWYKDGPVPRAPGDAVIEGHAGYPDAPLLFSRLGRLHPGDKIVVVSPTVRGASFSSIPSRYGRQA
jgi:sortase (surface protein transpeptidase)